MHRNKLNMWLLIVTIGLFSLNFTPVFAQQMLIQVVSGGYRFDGPGAISFSPVEAQFTTIDSEVSIRDITSGGYQNPPGASEDGFISIEDQSGGPGPQGSNFQVQISATGPLQNITTPGNSIPLTNFQVKNITPPGFSSNDVDTIFGQTDGLALEAGLNSYNDLSTTRVLATGTGEQPGAWKFYPGFRIQVPPGTAIGTYETTLTFTVI